MIWHPAGGTNWRSSGPRHERQAVTDAANRIDQVLTVDAHLKGEEFYGDRLLVEPPLAVTFAIYAADRIVQILQVWSR